MSVSPELEGLAKFAIDTRWEDLPEKVITDTKLFLMDSVGCGLGGITTDPGKMIIALAQRLGGPPESSIIGVRGKVSCVNAVLANGQLINTLDYEALTGHTPPYIVPPALAMAESKDSSGRDLITATAIALEISARVSAALASGGFIIGEDGRVQWPVRQGYANLNFGAAAAAGKIIGLNEKQMTHALGIAGHLSQVLTWVRYTFQEHRAMTKYGVPGWQNTGGVMATLLAEMGYLGDVTVFDAKEGFWKFVGYSGWHPERMLTGIGSTWMFFNKILFKPYPSCRQFQTETEIFLNIMEQNKLRAEEIEGVRIFGHPTLIEPAFTSRELESIVDINFSPAYTIAMAANGIPKGTDWQDLELARSPKISEFALKVSYTAHPDFRQKQASLVEVSARGKTFREERPFNSLHEMTPDELVDKYKHNASKILTRDQIQDSVKSFLGLENVKKISSLMSQIT
jgi:2-methylcitrate dehydratase PrpD